MPLKIKVLLAFALIAALIMPWPLFAGVCAQRVVKQRVVYSQPVYQAVAYQAVSPYSYAIGSDLVLEALAEKLSARIEEKLIQRQREAAPPQQSIIVEKCARCHSPRSKPVVEGEAPVFFNDLGELTATAEQRAGMRVAARLGSMPPPPAKELDDDEYLAIKVELERGIVRPAEPSHAEPQRTQPPIPNGSPRPSEELPPPPAPPGQ